MAPELEKYWFEPHRYGYGGSPSSWQGWASIAGYVTLIGVASPLIERSLIGYLAILVVATSALLLVSAAKTRGGWRWRWGDGP